MPNPPTPGPLRVVVADDHPVYRNGLRAALSSLDGFLVVGEACDGDEVVALAEQLAPDVVVMDIHMPGRNGIDAARLICEGHPGAGVLMLTMFEDDDSLFAAMRAGARGYLVKGAGEDEIVRAIRAVACGEVIFGAAVAARMIRYFSGIRDAAVLAAAVFPGLTDRENEILVLIAEGHNNAAIARRLLISPKTVRNYVSNVFTKLQVVDRAEAIVKARRAGLGDSPGT